jgi:outer membrane protein assembly factor BamE
MRAHRVILIPMRLPAFVIACSLLCGCGLTYKIDVQQGNYVTEDSVAKLKNGMTRAEVKQLLGTPLLADVFHANRWDYYFSNVKGGKAADKKRLTIEFRDDKVVSFGGTSQPPAPPPVGQAAAAAAPVPAPAAAPAPAPAAAPK